MLNPTRQEPDIGCNSKTDLDARRTCIVFDFHPMRSHHNCSNLFNRSIFKMRGSLPTNPYASKKKSTGAPTLRK